MDLPSSPGQWQDSVTVTGEQDESLLDILIERYEKHQQGARTSLDFYRTSETNFALQNEPLVSQIKQQDKSRHLEQQLLSRQQNQQRNQYQEQYQPHNLKFKMQNLKRKIETKEKEPNKIKKRS